MNRPPPKRSWQRALSAAFAVAATLATGVFIDSLARGYAAEAERLAAAAPASAPARGGAHS